MYQDTERFVDLDFEQRVRRAAYHLWEKEGRPFGRETDYWFKAIEQEMAARGQDAAAPPPAAND